MDWLKKLWRDERGEAKAAPEAAEADEGGGIQIVGPKAREKPEGPSLADALAGLDPDMALEPAEGAEEPEPDTRTAPQGDVEDEPEAGREPADDRPPAPEGEQDDDDEVELAADPEPEEEVEEEDEGPAADRVRLTVAPEEGDEPLEIEVAADDPEIRAALQRLQARAQEADVLERGVAQLEEQRAQIEADIDSLDAIDLELRMDPAGFIHSRVPEQTRVEVAKNLLYDDAVFEAVEEMFDEWSRKPHKREVDQARHEAQRLERRQKLESKQRELRESRARARTVLAEINDLIPKSMSPADAEAFRRDAIVEIKEHSKRNGNLTVEDIPKILGRRMRLYGIEPQTGTKKDAGTRARASAPSTGERFKKQVERRKKAGATAPATAGHIPSNRKPPKGSSLDDAFEWLDKQDLRGL